MHFDKKIEDGLVLAVCLPVAGIPELSKLDREANYGTCECDCGNSMWISYKNEQEAKKGGYEVLCIFCAVKKYGIKVMNYMATLE